MIYLLVTILKKNFLIRKFVQLFRFYVIQVKRLFQRMFFTTSKILIYHRIASVQDDPHQLSVSPDAFREQMIYLKRHYTIITVFELAKNIQMGSLKRNCIAVTFDDGYMDNLVHALPVLEELQIPATIFITTGKIETATPFYWDEKTSYLDRGRALTSNELKELSASHFIEIGSHTISHPRLCLLSDSEQRYEISESKRNLEKLIQKQIIGFSYPFGSKKDFDIRTVRMVHEAGYMYACANIQGEVTRFSDIFTLPRLLAPNTLAQFIKLIR